MVKKLSLTLMDPAIENLPLDGGCLIFDFVNTVDSWKADVQKNYLTGFTQVLQWSQKVEILGKTEAKELEAYAQAHPAQAADAFHKMIAARKIMYDLFADLCIQKDPGKEKTEKFNQLLAECFSRIHVGIQDRKTEIHFSDGGISLELPLWLVTKSAYDILTHADFERMKECPSCGWLFLDRTKNNKRRWCNMQSCGSNVKATRYYYRKKAKSK